MFVWQITILPITHMHSKTTHLYSNHRIFFIECIAEHRIQLYFMILLGFPFQSILRSVRFENAQNIYNTAIKCGTSSLEFHLGSVFHRHCRSSIFPFKRTHEYEEDVLLLAYNLFRWNCKITPHISSKDSRRIFSR